MEVTTMSPSAISPTEGDDLCEVDVTNVAIHSVTLLIGLCGLAGNGAVLCLLGLKFTNTFIFDVAVSDFLILLFAVPSTLVFLLEDMSCSSLMPVTFVIFLFHLSVLSYYWSSLREKYKLWHPCSCYGLLDHLFCVLDSALNWVFFVLITVIPTVIFLYPSLEQELRWVFLFSVYTLMLFLAAVPVVISTIINFINTLRGSQQLAHHRLDIIMFRSGLFNALIMIWISLQQYTIAPPQVVLLLTCIISSLKPFYCFLKMFFWRDGSTRESLQVFLLSVFDKSEENIPSSNDDTMDTEV